MVQASVPNGVTVPAFWDGGCEIRRWCIARCATLRNVFFAPFPSPPHDAELDAVANALDPVLTPLGFAEGQLGQSGQQAQVTFCRGERDSVDGACVDLVVDLDADPDWRITDVRYWGYPTDRWHLTFLRDADLGTQLELLRQSLPTDLA